MADKQSYPVTLVKNIAAKHSIHQLWREQLHEIFSRALHMKSRAVTLLWFTLSAKENYIATFATANVSYPLANTKSELWIKFKKSNTFIV